MNRELLKYEIAKRGYKVGDIAVLLNLSRQALNKRFTGETDFKLSEIRAICEKLNLTEKEVKDIFFANMSTMN